MPDPPGSCLYHLEHTIIDWWQWQGVLPIPQHSKSTPKSSKGHKHNPFDSLVTAVLEAKMDQMTMREWKRYTQDHKDIPPFLLLLEFVDLQALDMKNTVYVEQKQPAVTPDKKTIRVSYVTTKIKDCCVVCKAGRHPLHTCKSFQAFPHSKKVAIVRKNRLWLNCLKLGHFVRQCSCVHRCKMCQGPHHSSLHIDRRHEKKLNRVRVVLTWWYLQEQIQGAVAPPPPSPPRGTTKDKQ